MKQILRASLVVLILAGTYAGLSTPAPAMTNPQKAVVAATTGPEPLPCLGCSGGKGGNTAKAQ